MTQPERHDAEEGAGDGMDDAVPTRGYQLTPMVGLGGSAGAIPALQTFFKAMPEAPGMAFVVVMHLAPEHESTLAELLQRWTTLRVVQAHDSQHVEAGTVYVIPPGKTIGTLDDRLVLAPLQVTRGRHLAVDLFFRTLADTYGPHAAAVVLSGADADGAIGVKRIKERGGLTVAQDPHEAEHTSMPSAAIDTGMVDWVLPAGEIPARLVHYFNVEKQLRLPREDEPAPVVPARHDEDEAALREVLAFLHHRTGRDFSSYKRATVVRRIGRRMQVNGVKDLRAYLTCLRTLQGEAGALLQDLLISVTNFFRDAECFAALEAQIPDLFAGKGRDHAVRVWVPACATGEEAYSIAILLAEHARKLDAPPTIQVFATDLDEQAIRAAREGIYPPTIEADVSEDRLRRYFAKGLRGYQVRRELRETILFARHDLLKDSPFSRLDLVSCRNLLIYLKRDTQRRVFETLHFSLVPGGRLFLGSSESVEEAGSLFAVLDKKHRLFLPRAVGRTPLPPLPAIPSSGSLGPVREPGARGPVVAAHAAQPDAAVQGLAPLPGLGPPTGRTPSWGELHFKMLEALAPPSVLVDANYDILYLSQHAGRLLQYAGGEPSTNLLRAIQPALRLDLRAALSRAAQADAPAEVESAPLELDGRTVAVVIRATPVRQAGGNLFVVTLDTRAAQARASHAAAEGDPAPGEPLAHHLERELERTKSSLRETVEQYEASNEELKASNEELQAMNEELRSATEELETGREELQSINEELTTVNHELKSKVDDLAHANSDIVNLIDATAIATIFLDRQLCISRYTPTAVSLFSLIASDVGRPLADLATGLAYPQLLDDGQRVLARLVPVEREVGLTDGRWFLARLLPYRTIEDHIAGVVLTFIDITERKRAEEVRLWLSAVVASTTDAIISFSMDQTILSWNPGAERIFGYTAANAIGKSLSLLMPRSRQQRDELFEQVRQGRPLSNFEATGHAQDGTEIQLALSVSPIKDEQEKVIGGTAIARDVTQQKAAAEALRTSEERLRLLVENATEFAIFATDLQRRVTTWNSGAQRLLGYTETEALGQSADIIFTEEDRATGQPEVEMRTAVAHDRAVDERMHQRKDGSRFWASGAMMLMRDGQSRPVGFVKILRDQTAARESQVALERSRADLLQALAENEQARSEMQAADAAKDRFLAVLSHELRNPLASIDGAAALLQSTAVALKDREAAADVVKRQAGAMKSLLDELLDVSRLKLGRFEVHKETVRLNDAVTAALETTRPMLDAAGHELVLDIADEPIELEADPLRLAQVVANLLTNAIKYTPAPGRIELKASLQGDQAEIRVSDTGMGMEAGQIERMFEMFAQAEPVADRSHGLGIGLALVKNIVELHGGTVAASSPGPGKGSVFRVLLPARAGRPVPGATPAPAGAANEAAGKDKKRGLILIADDNVDAGWGIAKLLETAGFSTLRVQGGVDAVKETSRHKPDVGIIDIGMPDLDGHEVARQIRQSEWGRHMVLIAATGWGQQSDERAAIEAGFDTHMTKPVNLRKLSATVDELLLRKRA